MPEATAKEHPIIMQAHSVLAIQADLKTETRRVLTPHNSTPGSCTWKGHVFDFDRAWSEGSYLKVPYRRETEAWESNPEDDTVTRVYPKWQVGDRLWVKERIRFSEEPPPDIPYEGFAPCCTYLADNVRDFPDPVEFARYERGLLHKHRRAMGLINPIFMPRWASRFVREITQVRIQRLQEISEEDAIAEGVCFCARLDPKPAWLQMHHWPEENFAHLWDSINGKKHPWLANDWVIAYSFKKVDSGAGQ